MGTILTFGPYAPDLSLHPPSQTYTVTIPAETQKGLAQLGVAHFALIGVCHSLASRLGTNFSLRIFILQASHQPFLESLSIKLNIV